MWLLKMKSDEFGVNAFRYPSLSGAVKGFADIQKGIAGRRRKKAKFSKIERWFAIEQRS